MCIDWVRTNVHSSRPAKTTINESVQVWTPIFGSTVTKIQGTFVFKSKLYSILALGTLWVSDSLRSSQ